VFCFAQQVDIQFQAASFDVRTGEGAFAFPVHDRPARCLFGRAAALHKALEAVEQPGGCGVLPVEIRIYAFEFGHAYPWSAGELGEYRVHRLHDRDALVQRHQRALEELFAQAAGNCFGLVPETFALGLRVEVGSLSRS
jgi:hypothetical protein